jgi:hypothetical protein
VVQTLVVTKCAVQLSWPPFQPLVYGQRIDADLHLKAVITSPPPGGDLKEEDISRSSAFGAFAFSHESGQLLRAGTYTISLSFTPADSVNYSSASVDNSLVVRRHAPVLVWKPPRPLVYGQLLTSNELNAVVEDNEYIAAHTSQVMALMALKGDGGGGAKVATERRTMRDGSTIGLVSAEIPGKLEYSPEVGHRFAHVGRHQIKVRFTPDDAANHSVVDKVLEISVRRAAPRIVWRKPETIIEGTRLSKEGQLNATLDFPDFGPQHGKFEYDPPEGTKLELGLHNLSVRFIPSEAEKDNFDASKGTFKATVEQLVAPLRGGKKK